jgi:hypothetical protein
MPRVPYQPYSEVAPGDQAANIPTPPEAFGIGVARATEGLGEAVRGVGDKFFDRAVAFQELQNRASADKIVSDFTNEAETSSTGYRSLEGANAVNGHAAHVADLDAIREKYQKTAAGVNPEVEKLVNSETRNFTMRLKGAAGTHAAAGLKTSLDDASNAQIKTAFSQAAALPEDDVMFQSALNTLQRAVYEKAQQKGLSQESADEAWAEAKSQLAMNRVDALRNKPDKMQELLDKYLKDNTIRGEDRGKISSKVEDRVATIQAKLDADSIVSGDNMRWGTSAVTMSKGKMTVAHLETGGVTEPYKHVDVMTKWGQALGKYGFMSKLLPEFLKEAGMKPMTQQEFLDNPQAQEELFESHFSVLLKKNNGNFNEALKDWIGRGSKGDAYGTTADTYVLKANRFLAQNSTEAEKRAMGKTMADDKIAQGASPLYRVNLDAAIIAGHNRDMAEKRDTDYRTKDTLLGLVSGIDMPDGKKPTTVDELTAVSNGNIAWDRADNRMRMTILNALSANAKGDHAFTEDSYKKFNKLIGMSYSDDPKDREAYMDISEDDILNSKFPFAKRDALIKRQRQMKNAVEGNPKVAHALQVLAPDMNGMVDKKVDPDDWFQFVALLHDRLLDKQGANAGKALSDDDIRGVGREMLNQKVYKNIFGWTSKEEPSYRFKPSEEAMERIRNDKNLWTVGGQYMVPSDLTVIRYVNQQIADAKKGVTKEEKPVPKEPTKPVPPSVTDKLVGAIERYTANMRARDPNASKPATEEQIKEHQDEVKAIFSSMKGQ